MNPNLKKIMLCVMAAVIGIAVYQFVNHFIFKPPAFESQLIQVASELNKNCPLLLDRDTRLDNAMGGPGKYFTYNYTLIHHVAADLNIVELKQSLIPALINFIRTSEDMQTFRKEKVTLKYNYKDKEGVFLFSITVGPADYGR
jgi:hypothetical protein